MESLTQVPIGDEYSIDKKVELTTVKHRKIRIKSSHFHNTRFPIDRHYVCRVEELAS